MTLLTTRDVAERYGITPARVLQIASARGIDPHMTTGRTHLWTESQARRMQPGERGRPRSE